MTLSDQDQALAELLRSLARLSYRFTTVTPATHARVVARPRETRATLRDIFGWSLPFGEGDLALELLRLLESGGALRREGELFSSALRVASADDELFLHSAWPTDAEDAVFFGPDTYRFLRFIAQELPGLGRQRLVVDMGTGSGAGGIFVAKRHEGARIVLVDINPSALRLARINAAVAGVEVETAGCLSDVEGELDLFLANPPYMIDAAERSYRHGGDLYGGAVAIGWTKEALSRLRSGGSMLLYTGAAVVDGEMPLARDLAKVAMNRASLRLDEIDPDLFGEELEKEAYRKVERIAAIGAVLTATG